MSISRTAPSIALHTSFTYPEDVVRQYHSHETEQSRVKQSWVDNGTNSRKSTKYSSFFKGIIVTYRWHYIQRVVLNGLWAAWQHLQQLIPVHIQPTYCLLWSGAQLAGIVSFSNGEKPGFYRSPEKWFPFFGSPNRLKTFFRDTGMFQTFLP